MYKTLFVQDRVQLASEEDPAQLPAHFEAGIQV